MLSTTEYSLCNVSLLAPGDSVSTAPAPQFCVVQNKNCLQAAFQSETTFESCILSSNTNPISVRYFPYPTKKLTTSCKVANLSP